MPPKVSNSTKEAETAANRTAMKAKVAKVKAEARVAEPKRARAKAEAETKAERKAKTKAEVEAAEIEARNIELEIQARLKEVEARRLKSLEVGDCRAVSKLKASQPEVEAAITAAEAQIKTEAEVRAETELELIAEAEVKAEAKVKSKAEVKQQLADISQSFRLVEASIDLLRKEKLKLENSKEVEKKPSLADASAAKKPDVEAEVKQTKGKTKEEHSNVLRLQDIVRIRVKPENVRIVKSPSDSCIEKILNWRKYEDQPPDWMTELYRFEDECIIAAEGALDELPWDDLEYGPEGKLRFGGNNISVAESWDESAGSCSKGRLYSDVKYEEDNLAHVDCRKVCATGKALTVPISHTARGSVGSGGATSQVKGGGNEGRPNSRFPYVPGMAVTGLRSLTPVVPEQPTKTVIGRKN